MIIDAHHHLWDPTRREYPWMDGEALAPLRRAYTVDDLWEVTDGRVAHTVLVQTISDVTETQSFLATASTNDGLIKGVVGWVDLASPDVADRIARLLAGPGGGKLVGIRHQVQDEDDPRWLARPEVSAKISGLVTEASWSDWSAEQIAPYAKHALDVFGADRLMYGSDWPVCTLAASYEQVWELAGTLIADLSEAEREAILGGTAARVYRL